MVAVPPDGRRRRAVDVVRTALTAAREQTDLGAFWALGDERALAQAEVIDANIGPDRSAPLAGIPLAIKDNFDVAGLPTTGGIRGEHPAASADAEAVRRLVDAGAIPIGKTAMDPLAWTTHGQATGFPACLNPVEHRLSPGGSSSGSAVAVAAGIVPLALGSDTAGSIRIPAAYCGVVGLKPRSGEVPLQGCLPLSSTCDTAGLLGATVSDCAIAYDVLAGGGPASATAAETALRNRLRGRVAVLQDLFDATESGVAARCSQALPCLEAAGASLEQVRFGWSAPGLGLLLAVEFAAAWGAAADRDPSRFSPDMLEAMRRARSLPPERYQHVLAQLHDARGALSRRFGSYLALISPVVPVSVPTLEQEEVAVSTRFTRIFNALGWPALSVPLGRDPEGRPVAVHIATPGPVGDAVAVAAVLERSVA